MRLAPASIALLLALAGCLGVTAPGTPESPATDATTSTDRPTTASESDATRSPASATNAPSTPAPSRTTDFLLTAGGPALSDFRSLNVTAKLVAFQEGSPHQCHGKLLPPNATYTPTRTPDADAAIDCANVRLERTIDLTARNGSRSLGRFTVPAVVSDDAYLVVDQRNGTLESGERVRFDDADPGFKAEPAATLDRDGRTVRAVGLEVREGYGGYTVSDARSVPDSISEATPPVEYEVSVAGRVERDSNVTIRVRRDGAPAAGVPVAIDGDTDRERYVTDGNGEIEVGIGDPSVFEIEVLANEARRG